MNCRHHDKDQPCPECSFDDYAPTMYTPPGISECNASDMQKKLCLDGYGCYCEAAILAATLKEDLLEISVDLETENRRMLTAFDAIATIACDMLDPLRRAGPTGS